MTKGPVDNSAASRLQLEAQIRREGMLRVNTMDQMERADAQRQAYYAKFDRAVATLPPEKAAQVNLLSSYLDHTSTWHLRDSAETLVAQVRDPDQPTPEPTRPDQRASPAGSPQEKKLLRNAIKKIGSLDETLGRFIPELVEYIEGLGDRIKKLETQGAIDAEAIGELERIAERVEKIETRGFRFVGKYQAPATYTTGDVVTYRDALWHCVQDAKVGDRPSTSGHKWSLMLSGNQE